MAFSKNGSLQSRWIKKLGMVRSSLFGSAPLWNVHGLLGLDWPWHRSEHVHTKLTRSSYDLETNPLALTWCKQVSLSKKILTSKSSIPICSVWCLCTKLGKILDLRNREWIWRNHFTCSRPWSNPQQNLKQRQRDSDRARFSVVIYAWDYLHSDRAGFSPVHSLRWWHPISPDKLQAFRLSKLWYWMGTCFDQLCCKHSLHHGRCNRHTLSSQPKECFPNSLLIKSLAI